MTRMNRNSLSCVSIEPIHVLVPSYKSCDGPGVCGYDLHDGEGVAWGQEGKYSTNLYTQRARKILESHDPADKPLFLLLSLQVWRLFVLTSVLIHYFAATWKKSV